ncbi:MAG: T9SS type A sorting domain-containing protein [Bacteroidota bacterium]
MMRTLLPALLLSFYSLTGHATKLFVSEHLLNDSLPEIAIEGRSACPGEAFELEFALNNFVDIEGMQFTLSWEPSVLMVDPDDRFIDVHFSNMLFNLSPEKGQLEVTWFGDPLSMDDGEIFLKLNFEAVGSAGDQATFAFMDDPTPTEFTQRKAGIATLVEAVVDGAIVLVSAPVIADVAITDAAPSQDNGAINISVDTGTPPYRYIWSNGAETEDISGLAPGDYQCTITDSRDCQSITETFTVGLLSSLGQVEGLNEFSLSPNPVSEQLLLQVDFDMPQPFSFRLHDVAGKGFGQWSFNASSQTRIPVDLSHLPAGLYIAELRTASGLAVRKLLVQ